MVVSGNCNEARLSQLCGAAKAPLDIVTAMTHAAAGKRVAFIRTPLR
jgi:hypothetical protein